MPYKSNETLLDYIAAPASTGHAYSVLDLACGSGRSGLKLVNRNIGVVFADRSSSALSEVAATLSQDKLPGRIWQVDLEQADTNPFDGQKFNAIVCFRYLHRPLFPDLLNAVEPGGLVIYETFTIGNRCFGRPNNPNFLLQPGELKMLFKDWEILHYYEGIRHGPDREIAQIVARKPMNH